MYESCPDLRVIHDITNTSRHFELNRSKSSLKDTRKHEGIFDYTFDSFFDVSKLEVLLDDGIVISALNLIKTVLDFWINFFKDNYNIKISNKKI